ncbi:MAG: UvrB/UvrC motif-containing protein, partial [Oscillospiraceae bacterium]|nr:UvrB/UvrC motif-containing protein [Oscillospiraceae bacterium]
MQEGLDALRARKDAAVEAGDFDGAAKVRDELREASAALSVKNIAACAIMFETMAPAAAPPQSANDGTCPGCAW